jgi:uncharacterized protein YaaR (DUF327 family)
MARIDSLGEAVPYHVPDRKKAQKKDRPGARSFSRLVEAAESEGELSDELPDSRERRTIEELLDGVFSAGDELKKLATLDRIKEYRRRVKEFVKYVVSRTLAVEETTSGANLLRRKRFTLVRVIDRKLEELAVSVLSAQREQLAILAQVDEINGMLVDLVS